MLTQEDIQSQLIKSDIIRSGNFAAAAVQINENGIAEHAGIVILKDKEGFLFHYNAEDILFESIPDNNWYFDKDMIFIDNRLINSFIAHCMNIKNNANPKYGFFYDGSYYKDGIYFSKSEIEEYMTCVGFCLSVIKGFIEEDEYFDYKDWSASGKPEAEIYFREFIGKIRKRGNTIDETKFKEHFRRIKPSEYLTAAYLSKVPIRKMDIDPNIENVNAVLKSIRNGK